MTRPLALFTAGAPGAGKSEVLRRLALPLASLDVDDLLDELADGADPAARQALLPRAFELLERRQEPLIARGAGLVVNTTAADLGFVEALRSRLVASGYACAMLYVDAGLETAIRRNAARAHPVGEAEVRRKHAAVRANTSSLELLFAPSWWRIGNDGGLDALTARLPAIRAALVAML